MGVPSIDGQDSDSPAEAQSRIGCPECGMILQHIAGCVRCPECGFSPCD